MDWSFHGFDTSLPVWLILLILTGAITIVVWSYWSVNVSRSLKAVLIALRVIALCILALILLNPSLQRSGTEIVRHRIAVLLDNSLSAGLSVGSYRGDSSYTHTRQALSNIDTSRIHLLKYAFDRQLAPAQMDTLKTDGSETDIALALGTVAELERDVKAILLFTDGQFNTGRDPRFVADRLHQPVYIVGLGDSTRVRDIVLQDVIHPASAFKDTRVPVEVMVANEGFPGTTVQVQLRSGGHVLDTRDLTLQSERSVQSVSFEIELNEEGLRQYEALVVPVQGEWSTRNNRFPFSVDVRDNRLRILFVSFEVHPDVNTIRSVLETDESLFVQSLSWLQGERFIGGQLTTRPDTLDLVMLYGFPHAGIPSSVSERITRMIGQTSYVLAASPLFDPGLAMRQLSGSIPLTMPPVNAPFEVGLIAPPSAREHPILNFDQPDYERAPRLYGHIRSLTAAPGAETLFRASFRGADVEAPLLVVRTIGSRRTAVLNMFGYYVWQLSSNTTQRNAIQEMLRNLMLWTATKPDDRLLAIDPARRVFDSGESVFFNAFLKDESGLQVSDGTINLTLKNQQDAEQMDYTLKNDGLGKYSLDVGSLPEGMYQFDAIALRGSREIDRRSGQFSVSESVAEYTNTYRNDALLQDLAVSTGGAYLPWDSAETLIRELASRPEWQQLEQRQVASDWYPYRHLTWFVLVLILFAAEWVIRKFMAMP